MKRLVLLAVLVLACGCVGRLHPEEAALLRFTIASMHEVDVDKECRLKADRAVLQAHHDKVAEKLTQLEVSLHERSWWSAWWGAFADGFFGESFPHGSAP